MNKAKEISTLWSQIKPQIGELVRLCHEVESHYEVTADAYQRGYEAGLNDAWEAARKIADMPYSEEEKMFGSGGWAFVVKHTAEEAIEKIRQYEQEKEEQIQVGDEVKAKDSDGNIGIVTRLYGDGIYVTWNDGTSGFHNKDKFKKTGRHFPEIAAVLAKMKETNNG